MAVEMHILASREEWLANRKKGIGGSEISAVIGCNPYMDNVTLWKYKTGQLEPEDISDKPFVKYGNDAEYHLRELFKIDFPEYSVNYKANNSWTNSKYPWALASLDGWLEETVEIDDSTEVIKRKGILEIKTTEILNSMHREKWNKQIPQNYYCQVLFYMAVLEADFAVLKAQLKSEIDGMPYLQTKHYPIERADVEADIQYLMQEGQRFWQYVQSGKQPPLRLPEI